MNVKIYLENSRVLVAPEVVHVGPGDELLWDADEANLNWVVLFHDNRSPFDPADAGPVVHGRGRGPRGGTVVDRAELAHRYGQRPPWVIKYSVIVQKDGSDQPIIRDPIVVIRDVHDGDN